MPKIDATKIDVWWLRYSVYLWRIISPLMWLSWPVTGAFAYYAHVKDLVSVEINTAVVLWTLLGLNVAIHDIGHEVVDIGDKLNLKQ